MFPARKAAGIAAIAAALWMAPAHAQPDRIVDLASPYSYATMHCIGIEWPFTGDADHDATCTVAYRSPGGAWQQALPLMRVDIDRQHGFAGSIFDLQPGTDYEVRLELVDPDGGRQVAALRSRTRDLPVMPTAGRQLHVTPGTGGGNGSANRPFRGIAAAESAARPGDVMLLHGGDYGVVMLTQPGRPGNPIIWRAAGDGEVIIRGLSPQSDVWLHGLSFVSRPDAPQLQSERFIRHGHTTGLSAIERGARGVIITHCRFDNFHYAIEPGRGSSEWYIADNVIVGDNDPIAGGLGGEGVELSKSSGCIVAYNRISRVADGVSYPGSNCDIYGNDIFDVSDDGVETDMGQVNNRVWGNRITNSANAVFTFQPMNRGPWYFIRNQVVVSRGIIWKFVVVNDRFVALHNTFIFPKTASQYAQRLMNSFSRNNLYIAYGDESPMLRAAQHPRKPDRPGGSFTPTWMADLDYNGYDWSGMSEPFVWDGKAYPDLASLSAAVGIEPHSFRVHKEQIFENWRTPDARFDAPRGHMTLRAGSAAVDAGVALPNINEDYVGEAPDLGALERGRPEPHYGPREPAGLSGPKPAAP